MCEQKSHSTHVMTIVLRKHYKQIGKIFFTRIYYNKLRRYTRTHASHHTARTPTRTHAQTFTSHRTHTYAHSHTRKRTHTKTLYTFTQIVYADILTKKNTTCNTKHQRENKERRPGTQTTYESTPPPPPNPGRGDAPEDLDTGIFTLKPDKQKGRRESLRPITILVH